MEQVIGIIHGVSPFGPSSEVFISPYGFDGSNSGVVIVNYGDYLLRAWPWIYRESEMAGIRPCVKLKSNVQFNLNTMELEYK